MQTNQTTKTERNDTADRTARLARCAEALRRHGFEAVVTKNAQEAFERLRAAVEAEMPELVSFGDSMTMRDTLALARRTIRYLRILLSSVILSP